jgi:hypothetical protein
VAEVLPLSEGELRLLDSLVRHQVSFMLVGLSAAALQGAPVVTEDVDLWFENLNDPKLTEALREVGAAYVPPFGFNSPMLAGTGTDTFDVVLAMSGLGGFEDEIRNTVELRIGSVPVKVLSLERILTSKIAADRPKDRAVVPVLKATINSVSFRNSRNDSQPG